MSLINDALKKAQKQRTGDTPPLASMPGIGGEPAARIAQRAKSGDGNALLVRFGLIGGGVLALLIGGYFVLRGPGRPAAAPVAGVADPGAIPASPRPATPGPQVAGPGSQLPSPPSSAAASFTLPVAAAPAPVAGVADPGLPSVASAKDGPIPASPGPATPPAPAATKPVGKIDGKAINYIEALRIAGIRASATDSKVLMNDRVYRIGDIVEHEMGLKLVGITSSSLTFENETGARYTRNF